MRKPQRDLIYYYYLQGAERGRPASPSPLVQTPRERGRGQEQRALVKASRPLIRVFVINDNLSGLTIS
jgi:hypothetical protein